MAGEHLQAFAAWSRLARRLFALQTRTLPAIRREEARLRRVARIGGRGYRFPRSGR